MSIIKDKKPKFQSSRKSKPKSLLDDFRNIFTSSSTPKRTVKTNSMESGSEKATQKLKSLYDIVDMIDSFNGVSWSISKKIN